MELRANSNMELTSWIRMSLVIKADVYLGKESFFQTDQIVP